MNDAMRRVFIILFAIVSVGIIFANKSQNSIKQKQARTNKEISETTKKIDDNKKKTREQVYLLNQLSAEIEQKSESINKLKQSIDSIDGSMTMLTDSIASMEKNLVILREKYGETLRNIRASRHTSSKIALIASSNSFSEAFKRMRYLKQFAIWQTNKSNELKGAISSVNDAKNSLVQLHSNKASSIKKVEATQSILKENEKQQEQVVNDLGKERASLEAYLKEKQQEAKNLDAQLNRLIAQQQQEAERKRKEAERKRKEQEKATAKKKQQKETKKQNKSTDKATKANKNDDVAMAQPAKPAAKLQSQHPESKVFESKKGTLPAPVIGNYRVVGKFGRQKHPQFPNIQTDNSGIDIELLSSSSAVAICEGTVSAIFRQPGYNTIVMVRHGEYLSIYANLSSISVKTGDAVKTNQIIGNVYANPEDKNRRIMHFEIRKETTKLNPQHWIK